MLESGNMCVYRMHSNWDICKDSGVVDSLADCLGLGNAVHEERFVKTYNISPKKLEKLVREIRQRMGLASVRFYGEPDREITKVTALVGGLRRQPAQHARDAKKHGSVAIIAGDLCEHVLIYAQELGLGVIEAGHSGSRFCGNME